MSSRDEAEKWANDTNGGDGYTPVEAFIRGYLRGERVTLDGRARNLRLAAKRVVDAHEVYQPDPVSRMKDRRAALDALRDAMTEVEA